MVTAISQRPPFLRRCLAFSSHPAARLDKLIRFFLEEACKATDSDVGAVLLFGKLAGELTTIASANYGQLSDSAAKQLEACKWNPRHLPAIHWETTKAPGMTDRRLDQILFPVLKDDRSSLWVSLLDEKRVIGVLVLQAPRIGQYHEGKRSLIQTLARDAVPAIFRLILRENMASLGKEMEMLGESAAFLELEQQLRLVAAHSKAPVLLLGERGSGKELAATAIHYLSERRNKPFVPVLSSAFADNLFADELFGHDRGAFTGAFRQRLGKFKAAEGGTLFLDEVGDMAEPVQSALLRVVEHGELQPIGRDLPLQVDVRIIAATNRNLVRLIVQGRFRQDLYDRLRVFEIRVPPLRERPEDIPLLASHHLKKYCRDMQRQRDLGDICARCPQAGLGRITEFESERNPLAGCATEGFYAALRAYNWPGNVRELEHAMTNLAATVSDEPLKAHHLPATLKRTSTAVAEPDAEDLTLKACIRSHIERVLRLTNYNQSQAARLLGTPRSTLRNRIKTARIKTK